MADAPLRASLASSAEKRNKKNSSKKHLIFIVQVDFAEDLLAFLATKVDIHRMHVRGGLLSTTVTDTAGIRLAYNLIL
jgi:hypothetical protein